MRQKKTTPYGQLSRRKQRDNFIRLRQKIRNDTSIYGGEFTSDHVLNEPGRPALYNQWADAYFLGSDGLTIWTSHIRESRTPSHAGGVRGRGDLANSYAIAQHQFAAPQGRVSIVDGERH